MIQSRHPTFNIAYGKYIKPLEQKITKHIPKTSLHFGKGDPDSIAARIAKLSAKYRWYTEGDHSTFDAHVTTEHLKLTHWYYRKCFPLHHVEVNQLSQRTLVNRCTTRRGEKYTTRATRMSGDVDTSFGNSLINYAILREVLDTVGIRGECIVNGDDFILFTDTRVDITLFRAWLRTHNMDTDMKESTENIHRVEFCRSKFVINNEGRNTMMMDPGRLAGIYGMTFRNVRSYQLYLVEVALANASINKSSPTGLYWRQFAYSIKNQIQKSHLIKKKKNRETRLILTHLERVQLIAGELKVLPCSPAAYTTLDYGLLRQLDSNGKSHESTGGLTMSTLFAYPEIIELTHNQSSLIRKALYFFDQTDHARTTDLTLATSTHRYVVDHHGACFDYIGHTIDLTHPD